MRRAWVPVLLLILAGCGDREPCPFVSECTDAGLLNTCYHSHGLVGTSFQTTDCSQQLGQCAEVDAGVAACVPIPCDSTFLTHCSGTVLVFCDPSSNTVNATDCYDPYYDVGFCSDQGNGNAQCVGP
jgi:hypothetical protein